MHAIDKLNIDRAVALVLDKRYDNFIQTLLKFRAVNIKVDLFVAGNSNYDLQYDHIDTEDLPPIYENSIDYPTWHARPNAYNAFLCHKKIIRAAWANGFKKLLLLEDDSFVEDDFEKILEKAIADTDRIINADVLYLGGYHPRDRSEQVSEYVYKTTGAGGFHGVVINRKVMEYCMDFVACAPMDHQFQRYVLPKFECYAIIPSIISQSDGYSYVEGGNLSKPRRDQLLD